MQSKTAAHGNVVSFGEPLITEIEAAALLGLAVQILRDDRNKRRINIPFFKLGRSVRYRPSNLEAWLAKRSVVSAEEVA